MDALNYPMTEEYNGLIYSHPTRLHYKNDDESKLHKFWRFSMIYSVTVLMYIYMLIIVILVLSFFFIRRILDNKARVETFTWLNGNFANEMDKWIKYRHTTQEWLDKHDFDIEYYYRVREEDEANGLNVYYNF